MLALPGSDPFILDTDASDLSLGAELMQVQQGAERVISYASCALTTEQRKYCTTRKELLAVVRFTRQFRCYLLGRRFTFRTDHASLQWLMNFKHPQGQLARWLEELSQFNMVIVYMVILYQQGSTPMLVPCRVGPGAPLSFTFAWGATQRATMQGLLKMPKSS